MSKPQSRPGAKGTNKPGKQPIDPLLAQRLEQLGARRPAGSPLPPPTPGSAAGQASKAKAAAVGSAPAGSQEAKLAAAAARAAAARAAKQGGGNGRVTPPSSKRTKPAASSKVASVAISAATTLALAGWFAQQDTGATDSVVLTSGTDPLAATAATTTASTTAVTVLTTPTTAPAGDTASTASTAAPTTTAAPVAASGTIADGTYVGDGSRNRFGTVQVQVVYSGGQLTDVQILSYPDGDRRSIRINQVALPILIDEAVQAQGADISGVSGATYTSRSYVASLQSAIDNAKQASGVS